LLQREWLDVGSVRSDPACGWCYASCMCRWHGAPSCKRAHTYTHTHIHTHKHTHTQAHTQAQNTHTHKHKHKTHTHTHTHTTQPQAQNTHTHTTQPQAQNTHTHTHHPCAGRGARDGQHRAVPADAGGQPGHQARRRVRGQPIRRVAGPRCRLCSPAEEVAGSGGCPGILKIRPFAFPLSLSILLRPQLQWEGDSRSSSLWPAWATPRASRSHTLAQSAWKTSAASTYYYAPCSRAPPHRMGWAACSPRSSSSSSSGSISESPPLWMGAAYSPAPSQRPLLLLQSLPLASPAAAPQPPLPPSARLPRKRGGRARPSRTRCVSIT